MPLAGTWSFLTEMPVTGATSMKLTTFVFSTVVEHELPAMMYAVFETTVFAHAKPALPVIVNV